MNGSVDQLKERGKGHYRCGDVKRDKSGEIFPTIHSLYLGNMNDDMIRRMWCSTET